MSNKIEVLDTTLRDGAQGSNINYSMQDKQQIINLLTSIGIDLIESGNPSSNENDRILLSKSVNDNIVAFGSTRRKGIIASDDDNLKKLALCNAKTITIFGKSSSYHTKNVLNCDLNENISMIQDSITYLKSYGKHIIFDAEHFFDGYEYDRNYAIEVIKTAVECKADTIVLCDTNGGSLPEFVYNATKNIVGLFPDVKIGIHCHNDAGLAVANTMSAVEAGATHIQGTLLGMGERCGNTCLSTVIPNLMLKKNYDVICADKLSQLTSVCRHIAEITNISLMPSLPYVGDNAFTHKAGMHCDGVIKDSATFEHISPDTVGNSRKMLVSLLSGKSNIINKLKEFFPDLILDNSTINELLSKLKSQENLGYTYDGAEASFEILCKRLLGINAEYFSMINYKVITDQTGNNSAVIKVNVDDTTKLACGEGVGPVNALDNAMREALSIFYPDLVNVGLVDYKVRVIDSESATGAKVRVLVTSSDNNSDWTTVGVSADIIQASFIALSDSFNYFISKKSVNKFVPSKT